MAVINTDQLTLLREAHYEGSAYLVAGPQNVVFAARVNGAPSAFDFAQIAYDTVTVGVYTDLIVDMDVRISHTDDIRKAYFYGRVRKTATSSILYINETSAAITDNDYIFVINSYPMVRRQRYKTFFDWDRTYEPLPPIESNVPSAAVVLTSASTAEFSFESIGQALEKDATIASVLWGIPGVTYTVGDDESAEITIEVDTPYNEWGHLTLTDSNGTTNTLHFTITAGDPNTAPFFRLCHEDVPVSSDWDNGHSASATYWRGIDDLLDRTRITLVTEETFDGEPLGVGNVRFIGYLRNSTSSIAGDENYGQRKDAQLDLPGLMQLAGGLRFNPIAIRHAAAPAAWDYINVPTPPRNIVYALAHSTVLNLCSFNLNDIDETYLTGNVNVEETSLMDAVRKSAREINAAIVQSADGRLSLVQDPRIGSTAYRASLPSVTPTPIDLGDGYAFKFPYDSQEKVGWFEVGFALIDPTTQAPTFFTANAPASGPADGQEDGVDPSQLLTSTSDLNAALAEARQRTGDLFARANASGPMEVDFGSGWGGVVETTPGEYYQFTVDAEDDVRGNGIDPADNWVCLSINTTITRAGTQSTVGTFIRVTAGGNALIKVAISPSVVNTPIPILPVISPYPAIPMAASINYDSTTPTQRIPRDPFSGMQTLPLTTEEAAQAAQNQPDPEESRAFTYFSYDGDVTMGFTTVLNDPYTLMVAGSAKIGDEGEPTCYDFTAGDHGWTILAPNYGTRDSTGWRKGVVAIVGDRIGIETDLNGTFIAEVIVTLNEAYTGKIRLSPSPYDTNITREEKDVVAATQITFLTPTGMTNGVAINIFTAITGSVLSSTLRLTDICVVSGTGAILYADAFYQWEEDDEGKPINIMALDGRGLSIDGNFIGGTLPPFNENHEYTVQLSDFNSIGGTGYPISFRFQDVNYTDNARRPLNLTARGAGAGS